MDSPVTYSSPDSSIDILKVSPPPHSPPSSPASTPLHSPPSSPASTRPHSPPSSPASLPPQSPPSSPASPPPLSPPSSPASPPPLSPPSSPASIPSPPDPIYSIPKGKRPLFEKYRKAYFCPVEGCPSRKAQRKLSNHLIAIHGIKDREKRARLLAQSKLNGPAKPGTIKIDVRLETCFRKLQNTASPTYVILTSCDMSHQGGEDKSLP